MSEKQKILIIRLSSLGDVIFNIPLENVLKQNGYEISWLVGEKGLDVIQNNPCVDKVFFAPVEKWKKNKNIFQNIQEMISIIKDLRKENFDIAIDSQMLMKSILWTKFCGAKRRIIAQDAKEFSIIGANEIIPAIKDKFNRNMVNANLRFAQYLGLNTEKTTVTLPPSSEEVISKINEWVKANNNTLNIGVIKNRYSNTVGDSYMSFGCPKCDAIYGYSYLLEAIINTMYEKHFYIDDIKIKVEI